MNLCIKLNNLIKNYWTVLAKLDEWFLIGND